MIYKHAETGHLFECRDGDRGIPFEETRVPSFKGKRV